jgi:uncharacterized membrane protein YbaN (DUF454 family)
MSKCFYLLIFWCFSKSSTIRFNHVLVIDHVYGGINLLKYFNILATSPKTHHKIIPLNFYLFILFF